MSDKEQIQLNIDKISRGLVIDHITAGKGMEIYQFLGLDNLDCSVAIIRNVTGRTMVKKDIIKIENRIDIDLDALGYIDPTATVNIIDGNRVSEKKRLKLPDKIVNVEKCKNPRCITSIEQELPHVFKLADRENRVYRCMYCEQAAK